MERCTQDWKKIVQVEEADAISAENGGELPSPKNAFTLVLSADYQMSKLVPHWGSLPQLGSTYYLQKLLHNILGIVNHATSRATVYLFDEMVGPKNSDHTLFIPD